MKRSEAILLYFDRLEPLQDLSDAELGAVFRAIWNYAERDQNPDGLAATLLPYFRILRPCVDQTRIRYNETCVKNRYNRFRSECKKRAKDAPDLWDWWATCPDYEPALFKNEPWYDDAFSEHERTVTTVDDRQRPSTDSTNTGTHQRSSPGISTGEITGTQSEKEEDARRESFAQMCFETAERMKAENTRRKISNLSKKDEYL